MKTYFIIDHAHISTIEEATVAEAIQFQNWLDASKNLRYGSLSRVENFMLACPNADILEDLIKENGIERVIPIGSVEFVTRFCQEHGVKAPTAINIPPELDDEKYLQRKVWRGMRKEGVLALPTPGRNAQYPDRPDQYLIKPDKTIKRFEMTAFRPGKDSWDNLRLPEDEPLFVSEFLVPRIVAEWRLFIQNGLIQDIRQYYLKDWVMPDLNLCKEMAEKLKKHPSITLDVAVLEDKKTVAIEVHSFLACGFYGMEGTALLSMTKLAWAEQCKHKVKRG